MSFVHGWATRAPLSGSTIYQVTDDHFERAALPSQAVRNPVQQPAARHRSESYAVEADFGKPLDCKALRDHAKSCDDGEVAGWAIQDSNL